MLHFYQDIRLFPDQEVGSREIGNVLFSLLHLAFVQKKDETGKSRYAISFPEYTQGGTGSFGRFFRVLSYTREDLEDLNLEDIVDKLSGYAQCTSINEVPPVKTYMIFKRVQKKTNAERLARRATKRHDMTIEEARQKYKLFKPSKSSDPFFYIHSSSTDKCFPLSITCELTKSEEAGGFNLYGLSLPMFFTV